MKLADLRKSAGFLTQDAFATALGLKNRAVVARWEIGACYPRTRLIPEVARLLGVTEGDIISSIKESRRVS